MKPAYLLTLLLLLAFNNTTAANQSSESTKKPIRAQIKSKSQTILAAGITDTISHIHARTGDYVKKGQPLVAFACDRYKAAFDITTASLDASEAKFKSAEQLFSYNSIGPLEVELTKADYLQAIGEKKAAKADLNACKITAPYNAIIVKRFAQPYQYINRGEPLLEIYSPDVLEIHLVVPSIWLRWLKVGQKFVTNIDELDEKFIGHIERLGGVIDPVSQTVEVFGQLKRNKHRKGRSKARVLLGMSGWVTFDLDEK